MQVLFAFLKAISRKFDLQISLESDSNLLCKQLIHIIQIPGKFVSSHPLMSFREMAFSNVITAISAKIYFPWKTSST